ncbi:N-acetylglucosaminyl-phosphatidylinositol de-N-acetylase [Linum perenne]
MGFILIVVSLIVLWIASLYKLLHKSSSDSKKTFLREVSGGASEKRNVLLVVAHPDDESMFFSPTINHLISRGHNVYLLCFSIGNADGMGNTRKDELYQACLVLKVPVQQVKILDHPDLQDGFGLVWDHGLLSKIINEEVTSHQIDTIITFDDYGVSGHCNHCDVHNGVRSVSNWFIMCNHQVSNNILRKYGGPVDVWLSMLLATKSNNREAAYCLLNDQPWKSFHAMAAHSSQWVWFRKLFVLFSSYTYVNTIQRIN